MNSVSLIVLVIGLFLMIGYFQYTTTLIKNKKIEYRYIPRRLLDEQFDATSMVKSVKYLNQCLMTHALVYGVHYNPMIV